MAWVSVGDSRVRLANTILDDNPVVFAHFLVDPTLFARDVLSTYGHVFGKATIQNWLPAILLDQFGIDPHLASVTFVTLQYVLLALALLLLAVELTGSVLTGWLTVLFSFSAHPWRWNLAAYGSIMPWPYPGHLVLPLLLFAIVALLRGRTGAVIALLVGAALVHPAMTLCGVAIAGLFYLGEWRAGGGLASIGRAVSLVLPTAVCVVPAMVLTSGDADVVSRSDLMHVLRNNIHMNPQYFEFRHTVLPTIAGFLVLTAIVARWMRADSSRVSGRARRVDRVCLAAAIAMVILSTAHVVAMVVGIPRIAQVAGTRSSLMFVMVVMPLVIHYLHRRLNSESVALRWAAAALLILLALQQYGVFLGPLIVLAFAPALATPEHDVGARRRRLLSRTERTGVIILAAWALAIIGAGLAGALGGEAVSGRPLIAVLAPATYLDATFAAAVLVITVAAVAPYFIGPPSAYPRVGSAVATVTLCLAAIAAWRAVRTGRETSKPLAQANYDAQRWARRNTEPGSLFLITEKGQPWRTASLRSAVRLEPDWFYLYSGSLTAKKRYHDEAERLRSAFADDSVGLIHAFANNYDADYIVTRRDVQLELVEAYRNDAFTIYAVPGAGTGP